MIPFIPNDKFDIIGLEKCWKYTKENILRIESDYFSKLAAKTYELFLVYNHCDMIPKELTMLISALSHLELTGEYEKYSSPDIIKEITAALLQGLSCGFTLTVNSDNGKIEYSDSVFGILYNNEWYQLNAKSFDFSPIVNKQSIRI